MNNILKHLKKHYRSVVYEWAPWYIIPADEKWFRNFAVAQIVVNTLKSMKLEFPNPKIDL